MCDGFLLWPGRVCVPVCACLFYPTYVIAMQREPIPVSATSRFGLVYRQVSASYAWCAAAREAATALLARFF